MLNAFATFQASLPFDPDAVATVKASNPDIAMPMLSSRTVQLVEQAKAEDAAAAARVGSFNWKEWALIGAGVVLIAYVLFFRGK